MLVGWRAFWQCADNSVIRFFQSKVRTGKLGIQTAPRHGTNPGTNPGSHHPNPCS